MATIYAYGPLGAGHINPTLGIVSELVQRGHSVTYWAPRMFADRDRLETSDTTSGKVRQGVRRGSPRPLRQDWSE